MAFLKKNVSLKKLDVTEVGVLVRGGKNGEAPVVRRGVLKVNEGSQHAVVS